MKTLYMTSLGCPKNLIDSEVMLAALERDGYTVVERPEEASLLLVNTCGFIRPAVEEAIDEILEMAAYKEDDPGKRLVVTGCVVQRYGQALIAELPEVDLFIGLDDFPRIDHLLRDLSNPGQIITVPGPATLLVDSTLARRVSTPRFRSYLKITEGCDNRCTYCMIPSIRGALRSRSVEDLVIESRTLARDGVRELSLIAQDLTAYGNDRGRQDDLVRLLSTLLDQTDIPWFRLLYLYPSGISDALLKLMAAQPRILPYLDIPFQHVSDQVLRRMNRHYDHAVLDTLIARIRRFVPECAIRTTLMVGFPGETRADVDILIETLQAWQLDHVGVFQYQDEEGSRAASLPDKVAEAEKEERYAQVMATQAAISEHILGRFVGRVEPVLIEGLSRESDLLLEGRTRFQAPEIDGCVYVTSGRMNPGDIVEVRITEAHTYDLVGEAAGGAGDD